MNGLEAIELMEQDKLVASTDDTGDVIYIYKILNNNVYFKRIEDSDNEYQIDFAFDFSATYEEYIEPKTLTGWERVKEGNPYRVSLADGIELKAECGVFSECDYKSANYFSTKEKAEEIGFKQFLFRKLQRFSDENGGNEIDWENTNQKKYCILYCHSFKELQSDFTWVRQNQGQIYFISKEIAEKAIELFRDELIKYFTHDWSGKDETPINLNSEER